MTLEELEIGTIYKCRLSGRDVLVCDIDKPLPLVEGKEQTYEKTKVGKSFVNEQFTHDELFAGQLEVKLESK